MNSSATEAAVKELGTRSQLIHRIPMGVTTSPLSDKEKLAAASIRSQYKRGDAPLIIFVGRLVDEKGNEDFIKPIAILQRQTVACTDLVVGDGQDRGNFERLASDLDLSTIIKFVGWVDISEVRSFMAAAEVLVGPSRQAKDGWIEAQGLTFLEAMAVGTPVIASRLGGIVDSVIHESTGLLVEQRSPDKIARAIIRLTSDSSLRASIRANATKHVREEFSREVCAQRFSNLFDAHLRNKTGLRF